MMDDDPLLDQFAAIVGARHALRRREDIAPFLVEPRGRWTGRTPMVLRPGTAEQVSRIMALAFRTGTPIVPQGGNTGLVGGQIADGSGRQLVLSLSRLNRVREIDLASDTMTVEAGMVLQNVQAAAARAGRLFPLSLASQGSCQIGGNLSSNAGGTGVLAYGNARDLCLGLEVVLPDGQILDDLRKLRKDNTGYDLKDLFIGAEGTLGVITAAVVRLFALPEGRQVAWVGLPSPQAALGLLMLARARAGASLTAFEIMGRLALDFTMRHVPASVPPLTGQHEWHILMEVSSSQSAEEARRITEEVLEKGLMQGLVEDAVLASTIAQSEALWRLRESMSEAQRPEGGSIKHDISVPVAAIPEFIARAGQAVAATVSQARVVCFGHMGDGNLHYNVSQPEGADKTAYLARTRDMNEAVHKVVRALGGSISAEHGIGQMKRDELAATKPAVAIELMRKIKSVIDPAGIMNPGKTIGPHRG